MRQKRTQGAVHPAHQSAGYANTNNDCHLSKMNKNPCMTDSVDGFESANLDCQQVGDNTRLAIEAVSTGNREVMTNHEMQIRNAKTIIWTVNCLLSRTACLFATEKCVMSIIKVGYTIA